MIEDRLTTSYSGSMYNQEMRPLDYLYGPWDSFDQMYGELHVSLEEIEPGLTIGIREGSDRHVVEYWNPIVGKGFIKKISGGVTASVDNYDDALELCTEDNVGNIIHIKTRTVNDEGETVHESGLYIVNEENGVIKLEPVSSNITYGIWPESESMSKNEIVPVSTDGVATVKDTYRRIKTVQLAHERKLDNLDGRVERMVGALDNPDEHDEDTSCEHMYIQRVENVEGVITIKREPLDTDRIVMNGDYLETEDEEKSNETFIRVQGTNVGNYSSGDEIKNNTPLDELLRNLLVKELKPEKKPILPSVDLTIFSYGINRQTFEVGEPVNFDLIASITNGQISTFMYDPYALEPQYVDAGCSYSRDVDFYVKRPNEDGYSTLITNMIPGKFSEPVEEGTYTFKATIGYGANMIKPMTNLGTIIEDEEYNIQPGVATVEKPITIHVAYKMWTLLSDDDTLMDNFDINNFNEGQTWFKPDSILYDTIELNNNCLYVICPIEYEVVFDSQTSRNIIAREGGKYTHTLHNGETKEYGVWYMLNDGHYDNVRMRERTQIPDEGDSDSDSENEEPDVPTIKFDPSQPLWKDIFCDDQKDDLGMTNNEFKNLPTIDSYNYHCRTGQYDNATDVTFTWTGSVKLAYPNQTQTGIDGASLWFNKSENGTVTTTPIKLYGATNLEFCHTQGTKNSQCHVYYVIGDEGENWIELDGSPHEGVTQTGEKATYPITVPAGTETVRIKLEHKSSNAVNTRIDNLELWGIE